ncbi:hypothetical protein [uncultured Nostoc sp.]|uniref:hypothetical protein n=1 Tax=uncultured Nostoc sp. TaxID=340711 RepID=UPI0035CB4881
MNRYRNIVAAIAVLDAESAKIWRGLRECYAVDVEEKSQKKEPDLGSLIKNL